MLISSEKIRRNGEESIDMAVYRHIDTFLTISSDLFTADKHQQYKTDQKRRKACHQPARYNTELPACHRTDRDNSDIYEIFFKLS